MIRTYLLEKSRIVRQLPGERNYHIFYQLLAGSTPEQREEYGLGSAEEYFYLNQSGCLTVDSVDDSEVFMATKQAMSTIGIKADEQAHIFKLVASILHFGNIEFKFNESTNSCSIVNENALKMGCKLIQVDPSAIAKTFLTRNIVAVRESYIVQLTKEQAGLFNVHYFLF